VYVPVEVNDEAEVKTEVETEVFVDEAVLLGV
jgi:hypothetical protein